MSMNTINLIVGDWSDDGHGKTDTITITTNLSRNKLEAAYKRGAEKCGVDLGMYCSDYEDNVLPAAVINKLIAAGIDIGNLYQCDAEEVGDRSLDSEDFARLWLNIALQGEPLLVFTIVPNTTACINIGGYGLFFL